MKLTFPALLIFFAAFSIPSMAQKTITLKEAIHDAWQNRKNIQAGRMDSAIQKLETEALLKKYWPQVTLDYSYDFNPILQSSILPIGKFNPTYPPDATAVIQFGTRWSQAAGITVIQPLVDASIKRQIRESNLKERITGMSQSQTEYELAYEVAKAFINIWLQEEQLNSSAFDSSSTWVSYQLQQEKFDAGRLLKSDLNKALINHNTAVQKVTDAKFLVIEKKIYLLFLTGKPSSGNFDFEIDTTYFQQDIWRWRNLPPATGSIPVFQQLKLQQNLSELQQQSEKAKYLPTLNLKGFLGANQYTNHFNPVEANTWFGYSYVGINAKLPLLFGEDKQKKIRSLQIQADQYNKQLLDHTDQYAQESLTAKYEMDRMQSQLRNLEANLNLSRESVRILQDRVQEGQESPSNLNTEELENLRISADYNTGRSQAWLYWLDYMKATGLLIRLWN